jgi:hypothetical protein
VHASTLGDEEDCPFDFRDVMLATLLQQQQQPSSSSPPSAKGPTQRWMTRDALLHSLSFSLKGLQCSRALSMDVVGLHDAAILPTTAATAAATTASLPPVLISEVELQEDGSKVVTLRSRVCVQNKAGAPVYLLITADNAGATTASGMAARPNISVLEEVLLQPEETKYLSAALLGPNTALFVRASPAHGWAPLFASIADMDAFMEGEAATSDGSGATASLVCESPPLDEAALPVPNDDSDEIFLAGSSCIGVEVCTDQVRGGGAAAGASGGGGGRAPATTAASSILSWATADGDAMRTAPPAPTTTSLLRPPLPAALQQRDSFESVSGRDSLGDNSLPPGVKGETLHIRRHDAAATLRNLVATVKRSASGVGGNSSSSSSSSSSSRRPGAAARAAATASAGSRAVRRIILRPAFVLHNLYPTPLLYRLCDKNGYVASEGALPVGAAVPIFGACVKTKQYLSVRAPNHLWSSYTRVHTPKAPYPLQERVCSMEMKALGRWKGANGVQQASSQPSTAAGGGHADFDVPTQVVSASLLGRHLRLFSKVAACNRSSLVLDYRDGSLAADVATTLTFGMGYLRQPPLGGTTTQTNTQVPSPGALVVLPPPLPPPSPADGMCPPAIGVKVKPTTMGPDAATVAALSRPVSSGALVAAAAAAAAERGSDKPTAGPIVTVSVLLPFNHLDVTTVQLSSEATLDELFVQLTEKVNTSRKRERVWDDSA